jgi:hypothetical protein
MVLLMWWHSFLFLRLRHVGCSPPFSLCLVVSTYVSCKNSRY